MGFYTRHLLVCTNQSKDGRGCGASGEAMELMKYAKSRLDEMGLMGPGQYRANKSGCLGRCGEGPVAVVYPDDVWYTYASKEDMDEIIDSHLLKGEVVERLKLA